MGVASHIKTCVITLCKEYFPGDTVKEEETAAEETTALPETTAEPETTAPETTSEPETTSPPETTAPPETTEAPVTTAPPPPPETEPETTAEPVVTEPATDYVAPEAADPTEFDNSLFIGDSRTVGISAFGGLGSADVFATKGMSIYRAFTETLEVRSSEGEAVLLEYLLTEKTYDRVYIMLGINEIGTNIDVWSNKYSELVNYVRETQPEATVYVCANLHITHSRSEKDETYNNTRLNAMNNYAASLANGESIIYVDVNVIFDDSNQALGAAYCTDDFHPMPKYYKQWVEWLANVT